MERPIQYIVTILDAKKRPLYYYSHAPRYKQAHELVLGGSITVSEVCAVRFTSLLKALDVSDALQAYFLNRYEVTVSTVKDLIEQTKING